MACEICGNKPMNCDCTEGDKKAYDLEDELNQLKSEMSNEREQERKMLFKQVALVWLEEHRFRNSVYDSDLDDVRQVTESIITAANKFAKEQS